MSAPSFQTIIFLEKIKDSKLFFCLQIRSRRNYLYVICSDFSHCPEKFSLVLVVFGMELVCVEHWPPEFCLT